MKKQADVYIFKQENKDYPVYPFNSIDNFPELNKLCYETKINDNESYKAIREILFNLGFDQNNYGTENWNPLKVYVNKGDTVLLKPNLVYHEHPNGEDNVKSMITNASILRVVIDYVLLATKGKVKIIIGDAPVQGAVFKECLALSGIDKLVQFYKENGIDIEVIDFRKIISIRNSYGILDQRIINPTRTDNLYSVINLKDKSEMYEIAEKSKRLEITNYTKGSVSLHHNEEKNEYIIPKEILEADVFINLPKLKTHRKAGVTCAMKNLVGINGDKTCIAHHTRGYKENGGDEFNKKSIKHIVQSRLWDFLKRGKIRLKLAGFIKLFVQRFLWKGKDIKAHAMAVEPKVISEGNWYGNDTIWRCVKDLNKIILFANKQGKMCSEKQRKYLCIVDAILAGEGEGPMEQTTRDFGVVFGGTNPVYVDYAATKLMKYDYKKIPVIEKAFSNKWWNLVEKNPEEIVIQSNYEMDKICQYFLPTFGWKKCLKETSTKRK